MQYPRSCAVRCAPEVERRQSAVLAESPIVTHYSKSSAQPACLGSEVLSTWLPQNICLRLLKNVVSFRCRDEERYVSVEKKIHVSDENPQSSTAQPGFTLNKATLIGPSAQLCTSSAISTSSSRFQSFSFIFIHFHLFSHFEYFQMFSSRHDSNQANRGRRQRLALRRQEA